MRIHRVLIAIGALATALGLAACGSDEGGIEGDSGGGETTVAQAEGKPSGDLYIANWPFYIDKETVADFEKETGINVTYREEVNDNNEFFGKVQPLLDQGESGGRDIFVVTDWMAKKMY